ncbi:hypothetical protein [Caenibius sp. WL]|uniref:hypothetical protein n=1 Tax=Caenibius sp. WL TaxID=2872646 RepID=UPI001C992CAA|nr:hypothetical protein [Caenibius sp. WL]QZP06773.1 hypothetical protein K5X80_08535 [Caenibius sp. WL]
MADRIAQILEQHIKVLMKKLDLIAHGVEFEDTAEEIALQLANIQGQLARHVERNPRKA